MQKPRKTLDLRSALIIADSLSRVPVFVVDEMLKELRCLAPELLWTRNTAGKVRVQEIARV